MPIKIKRGREQSRASVRTSRATAMPPTIPASGRQTRPTAGKNSTSASTTMLAPSLTPISPGSASPLRVMLCIAAPAIPSMAPHSSAIRIRGRRISNRIKRGCSPISCGASRARASVDAGNGKLPRLRLYSPSASSISIMMAAMLSAAGRSSSWREAITSGRKPAR